MGSSPPSFAPVPGGSAERAMPSAASSKWSALHDAAGVVAHLAGLEDAPQRPEIVNFPAAIRDAAPWRRETAEKGIDDLAAIMEPGIAALLAVNARGADAQTAALALWCEFDAARAALLELAIPTGDSHPNA